MEAFGDCIEVKEEIHGFRWVEERDLSGFVDGTENPAGEETRREVAVIKDGVDAGGSYVFVQRWEHNLKQLNRMSVHDQEMMIGRTKEANEEIDGDERPEPSPRPDFSFRFARWLWFFSRRISNVHLASYRNEVYIRLKQTFCLPETEPLFR